MGALHINGLEASLFELDCQRWGRLFGISFDRKNLLLTHGMADAFIVAYFWESTGGLDNT